MGLSKRASPGQGCGGDDYPGSVPLSNLDYDLRLTESTLERLEEAARSIGLPLRELELLGQCPSTAHAFIESVQQGRHGAFLDRVDWHGLEHQLRTDQDASLKPSRGFDLARA